MSDLIFIQNEITRIGNSLVNCNHNCEGISYDLKAGILPRCLFMEMVEREKVGQGCAVIGINPGICDNKEKESYLLNSCYQQTVTYWNTKTSHIKYYDLLRNFVNELGFTGPILWSELVKCQNETDKLPPLQTFRNCTKNFLNEELKVIPKEWPLIAVGGEAYKALSYIYPERIIIGFPHPTGSYGHFYKLFDNGKLLSKYKVSLADLWNGTFGLSVWLSDMEGKHESIY